jgi:hypothetical protein
MRGAFSDSKGNFLKIFFKSRGNRIPREYTEPAEHSRKGKTDMEKNISSGFFSSAEARRLAEKKTELAQLAASEDGKRVRDALSGGGDITGAFERGDMETVTGAISGILSTPEGARLAKALQDLMK